MSHFKHCSLLIRLCDNNVHGLSNYEPVSVGRTAARRFALLQLHQPNRAVVLQPQVSQLQSADSVV